MRYLLSLFVLTLSGCCSSDWINRSWMPGWTAWNCGPAGGCETQDQCCPLETADPVMLEPAPMMHRPIGELPIYEGVPIEESFESLRVPETTADPDVEMIPVPTPDPAT